MNTMKWLVKREYWEGKGGFFWAPLVMGGIAILFALAATVFGKSVLLFDGVPRAQLHELGEVRNPGVADLFVATMKGTYA